MYAMKTQEENNKTEEENIPTEEFKVSGEDVVKKVKEIIEAGNARKIIIKNEKEESVLEIPLTLAVIGTLLLPVLAAVGAVAAFMTKSTIVVQKRK